MWLEWAHHVGPGMGFHCRRHSISRRSHTKGLSGLGKRCSVQVLHQTRLFVFCRVEVHVGQVSVCTVGRDFFVELFESLGGFASAIRVHEGSLCIALEIVI